MEEFAILAVASGMGSAVAKGPNITFKFDSVQEVSTTLELPTHVDSCLGAMALGGYKTSVPKPIKLIQGRRVPPKSQVERNASFD